MSQTLTVEYPDLLPDALNMSRAEFESEARMALAAKLYELGRLSSMEAARMAGLDRVRFLLSLERFNVSTINLSEEELTQEFAHARETSASDQQQPLIALCAALSDLDLLGCIVERLIVPSEVLDELAAGGLRDDAAVRVRTCACCTIVPARTAIAPDLINKLGAGEAAVIQTALDEHLPLVVIDEVRGRRTARLAGLQVIGSLGLLMELHRAGKIVSLSDAICRMTEKGIYLSPRLIQTVLAAALGEEMP